MIPHFPKQNLENSASSRSSRLASPTISLSAIYAACRSIVTKSSSAPSCSGVDGPAPWTGGPDGPARSDVHLPATAVPASHDGVRSVVDLIDQRFNLILCGTDGNGAGTILRLRREIFFIDDDDPVAAFRQIQQAAVFVVLPDGWRPARSGSVPLPPAPSWNVRSRSVPHGPRFDGSRRCRSDGA